LLVGVTFCTPAFLVVPLHNMLTLCIFQLIQFGQFNAKIRIFWAFFTELQVQARGLLDQRLRIITELNEPNNDVNYDVDDLTCTQRSGAGSRWYHLVPG